MPDPMEQIHASAIAVGDAGCLITGGSGSGKSTLALELIALGAMLISDDRTDLWVQDGAVWAGAPNTIAGLIEARGIGLIRMPYVSSRILLAVDMDSSTSQRLPDSRETVHCGIQIQHISGKGRRGLAPGLMAALRHGIQDPDAAVVPNTGT